LKMAAVDSPTPPLPTIRTFMPYLSVCVPLAPVAPARLRQARGGLTRHQA